MRNKNLNTIAIAKGLLLLTANVSMAGMLTFDGEIRERFETHDGMNKKAYGDCSINTDGEVEGESNDTLLLSRVIAGSTYRQNKHISCRVCAACGGIFIVLSIIWGWHVDQIARDRFDIMGGLFALVGVMIIMRCPEVDMLNPFCSSLLSSLQQAARYSDEIEQIA